MPKLPTSLASRYKVVDKVLVPIDEPAAIGVTAQAPAAPVGETPAPAPELAPAPAPAPEAPPALDRPPARGERVPHSVGTTR